MAQFTTMASSAKVSNAAGFSNRVQQQAHCFKNRA
jgi:hypothetical protein